jgi:hypothetical protein
MKLCQNIIKRKHPKQGRENETWGKDQSWGKIWPFVYWPTMMLSLLVHHSEKFFLMYLEGTIIIMFISFTH